MSKRRAIKEPKASKSLVSLAGELSGSLLRDVRQLIESGRQRAAAAINAEMTLLYWQIGSRIRQEVLKDERAGYGERIVSALRRQLSWSHVKQIIYLENDLQRSFYIEICRIEKWSTRTLEQKIRTMMFERTAISRKPEQLIKTELNSLKNEDRLTSNLVFRDPYILDFLGLHGEYSERDVEAAVVRELERFILEFGTDFAFVARQKRIMVDQEDYYLDLLFYHRRLKRLIAIELKLGKFQAADKGQMELYLRWLDKHERQTAEDPPIGLILCAGKTTEHVELLELEQAGIRVAQYMIQLPPRDVLERKLHDAIKIAR